MGCSGKVDAEGSRRGGVCLPGRGSGFANERKMAWGRSGRKKNGTSTINKGGGENTGTLSKTSKDSQL